MPWLRHALIFTFLAVSVLASGQSSTAASIRKIRGLSSERFPYERTHAFLSLLSHPDEAVQVEALKVFQSYYSTTAKSKHWKDGKYVGPRYELDTDKILAAADRHLSSQNPVLRREALRMLAGFGFDTGILISGICLSGAEDIPSVRAQNALRLWSSLLPGELAPLVNDEDPVVVLSVLQVLTPPEIREINTAIKKLLDSKNPELQMIGLTYFLPADSHRAAMSIGPFLDYKNERLFIVAWRRLQRLELDWQLIFKHRSQYSAYMRMAIPQQLINSVLPRAWVKSMLEELTKDRDKRVQDEAYKALAKLL